ncbi:MAG TPA: DUF4097 family beta strand repeat-containing protein [Pyrinomonadaceae bacterium]|nr:DUF4097 family beta strand repeat-containing protein [Pyrinomonadaceae bacterium]
MKGTTKWVYRATFAAVALSLVAGVARAQQAPTPSGKESPQIESELRSGGNFHSSFASSEFASQGGTIIQGAPFSAVGVKETAQILSDGRRITRRMVQSIYRNSEGSTRNEWGNETKSPTARSFPIIYDAATGALYFGRSSLGSKSPLKDAAQRKVKVITPQSPPDDITRVLGETIEPLGTKTIEGVTAEGVRVTTTIPMTEIGGVRSNKVIYERWYSQELRRNVLIKVTDPRFGEAVYRLTRIDRNEPARELFQTAAAENAPTSSNSPAVPVEGERNPGAPVSVKLERGGHVSVDNRTTGRIRIIGWDRDTVEATATSERGVEAVRFAVRETPEKYIWLKADYLERDGDKPTRLDVKPRPEATPQSEETPQQESSKMAPAPSTLPLASGRPANMKEPFRLPGIIRKPEALADEDYVGPPMVDGQPLEVHLEVRVPRYAEIELIKVIRSPVEVTGVETPIVVLGNKGDVVLKNVRDVEVRTRSGSVEIEDAAGFVEVVTAGGPIQVRRAGGDVRVLSISGKIEIECVRGRVNVDSADGSVTLSNVQGDVEANSSNSNVLFTGAIREDGRYHLKTMSGAIEMAVRDKGPGFTAALSSYTGTIENDFQLQIKQSSEQHMETDVNRRIIGSHGNGRAQITLDSFDGKIKLAKLTPGAVKECKIQN